MSIPTKTRRLCGTVHATKPQAAPKAIKSLDDVKRVLDYAQATGTTPTGHQVRAIYRLLKAYAWYRREPAGGVQ